MKKLIATLLFLIIASPAMAGKIGLQWNSNTEPDLATGEKARYKVYYRVGQSLMNNKANATGSVNVRVADDEDPSTAYVAKTITSLDDTKRYYFAATALDETGNESILSNEVNGYPTDETAPAAPGTFKIILQKIITAWKNFLGGLRAS